MGRIERGRELARQRKRRTKLRKLRGKYTAATSQGEKDAIKEKVRRISPFVDLDADLTPQR